MNTPPGYLKQLYTPLGYSRNPHPGREYRGPVITCVVTYTIDPGKIAAFEEFAAATAL